MENTRYMGNVRYIGDILSDNVGDTTAVSLARTLYLNKLSLNPKNLYIIMGDIVISEESASGGTDKPKKPKVNSIVIKNWENFISYIEKKEDAAVLSFYEKDFKEFDSRVRKRESEWSLEAKMGDNESYATHYHKQLLIP